MRRGDPRQAVVGGSGGFGGVLPRLHALGERVDSRACETACLDGR